ncbi:NAD(P)-dependent dehydrogenase (short-subunit alcohol dehydrogenase family) [Saccharothrix tamanrassetensis]|uniref:NAD(P)-dependent dehydrogenase (Short-subunit alcohol dehydrogenase family) n=1 Tax=Saccharothrix tamanrassetensis TaxID=1051531 RepID=A0A841CMW5_9PSEU|nr:SDR family NAD(P)-dependent oxidoreductase [Saccharothrix tamanrassetensis]MBB5957427.1 NAD(P)-dependent dehydrogenase (short-subunit alcohol dehydrogenase family) [Saccharothrix tamanrassetensis]
MNDTPLRHAVFGRTVLLVGTACGVTEAATRCLARVGAKVLVATHLADQPVAPAREPGGPVSVYRVDHATPVAMRMLANQVLDEHDDLDLVIHNAGTPPRRPATQPCRPTHGPQHPINTHYVGPSTLIRSLLPAMRTGNAHLINISPAHVRLPVPAAWGGRRASQAAFDVWFRSLTPATHDPGFTTTSIYRGLIGTRTGGTGSLWARSPDRVHAEAVTMICDAITLRPRQIAPWWVGSADPVR